MAHDSHLSETFDREELGVRLVNTVAWRLRKPEDRAASPEAMLIWLADAGLTDRRTIAQIMARWKKAPREARLFLKKAVQLREAIYGLFLARIKSQKADPRAVVTLNSHLAAAWRNLGLASSQARLKWRPTSPGVSAEALLKPIAWSAVGLLMGPRAQRLKQCQDERGCGWLFIDESRAQNRRWCSMGDCGNLAKSRRHYHRASTK